MGLAAFILILNKKVLSGESGSVLFLDGDDPALGIGDLAPLHTGHGIVQLLGDRTDLAVADVSVLYL